MAAKQKIIDLAFAHGCSDVAGYKSKWIFMPFWICISNSHFLDLRAKLGILECFDSNDLNCTFLAANQLTARILKSDMDQWSPRPETS